MIYENISLLCEEKGISIANLEKELGMSNATIAKWKTCSPTVARLKLVADFFGVTMEQLISPKEEKCNE